MSASQAELETPGLDAAVIAQLQAVISSNQLNEDAITEKLSELLDDKSKKAHIVPATASIEGKDVNVKAPAIQEIFKGKWNREESAEQSTGYIRYLGKAEGRHKIALTLIGQSPVRLRIIVFRKVKTDSDSSSGKQDAWYYGTVTKGGDQLVGGHGEGEWGPLAQLVPP